MYKETRIIDGTPHRIHKINVFEFMVSDAEDPVVYAAEPLYAWQNSEEGKWIFEHSLETPVWHQQADIPTFGHKFVVTALLKECDKIIWTLKFK